MGCQVKRNDNGTNSVTASNGERSMLYDQILELPGINTEYEALDSWMKVYTDTFKKWYGKDWEQLSETELKKLTKEGYLDSNGEPVLFFRGEYTGLDEFNYSAAVGKFGQGIYLTDNKVQAEAFGKQTGKEVYPVFLRPTKSINFKSVNAFLRAAGEFNKTDKVPSKGQVETYVKYLHQNNTTIIGKALMGNEFNTFSKDSIRTVFSKGIKFESGIYYDSTSVANKFMTKEFQDARNSDQFVYQIIEKLVKNFGLDYSTAVQMVSKDEAAIVTKGTDNEWSGQPAFFHEGKVYFVKGLLRPEMAFHEFAHPFVRTLMKENPELFNRIYDDVLKEGQGQELKSKALEKYPTLNGESDQIKEEVVVTAMTFIAKNEKMLDPKLQPSKGIVAAIKKFFYAVKQILRKLTKKKDFKNLSPTTSLKELSEMMLDDSWNVDMSIISEENVTAYYMDYVDHAEALNKYNNTEGRKWIHELVIDNTKLTLAQIRKLRENENYEDLRIALSSTKDGTTLDEMSKNLKSFNTKQKIIRAADEYIDELEEFNAKVQALSFNLSELDLTVKGIKADISDLVDEPDQRKALSQVSYYTQILDQWDLWLQKFLESAEEVGIKKSALRDDILNIREGIRSGKADITSIYKNATRDQMFEMFEPMNKAIVRDAQMQIDIYNKKLKKFEPGSKNALYLEREIKYLEKSRDNAVVDKDKMLDYITGKMGDIGSWHAWLESYTANQDPSIASFGMFIKQNLSDVQTDVHQRYNQFVTKMEPLLEKLNIGPSQVDKFSKQFLYLDTSFKKNEEGEIEEFKVHSFLSEHIGWKYTIAKLQERVSNAEVQQEEDPKNPENIKEFIDAVTALDNHTKYFFNNPLVDEYYHADDGLVKTEIGRKAKKLKDQALERIEFWQKAHKDDHILYEDFETAEVLWREYKQLFSLYNEYGQMKKDEDLAIAEALTAHREATREFYEYELIEGVFQKSLQQFTQKETIRMLDEGWTNKSKDTANFQNELTRRRDTWIKRNTQIKIKSGFYEQRNNILNRIKEIMSKVKTGVKFDTEWQTILDSLQGRRDANGQPVGDEMTEEHRELIKNLQETMENAKSDIVGVSGLSQSDWAIMGGYYKKMDEGNKLTPTEWKEYVRLRDQKNELGLSKALKNQLFKLFDKLDQMQDKIPTEYYVQQVNEFYRRIQDTENKERRDNGKEELSIKEFDLDSVSDLTDIFLADDLIEKDEEFKKWFHENHLRKEKFNQVTEEMEGIYERIYVWTVIKPSDPNFLETTEVRDENQKVIEVIQGTPTVKYWKRKVKDEYYTGYNKATGEIEDLVKGGFKNNKGRWLPKTLAQMEEIKRKYPKQLAEQPFAYDNYINYDYINLKAEYDKKINKQAFDETKANQYELLELLKEFHLEGQEGLENQAKLDLELPRFRKDLYEYITSKGVGKDAKGKWGELAEGWAQFWAKRKDDLEDGLNYEQEMSMISIDMYSGENGKVPIRGKYMLEEDQVSKDITGSMMMYYQSAAQNKKLVEIQPIARAMQKLAGEQNPVELESLTKQTYRKTAKQYLGGNSNNRKKVIDSMVETFFEGKKLFDASNNPKTIKLINNALGMASHAFFAFDVTSALKNHIGAQFQIALEGAGGKYFSYTDWHRGRPWAHQTMWEISNQIYKTTAKTKNVQLVEIFDAIQGRFETKFGESLSRSFARDAANLTWTTSHRKWLETEATLQLFSAIMNSTKVKQTIDGVEKEIRYIDAWEIDENTKTIKLKEGIDKEWDIKGEYFNDVKFKNQEVSNLLQGAYADFDQPMVNRHILWRLVSSMRKFFTKMFIHRYGMRGTWWNPQSYEERYNLPTKSMHMGFYMRNLATLMKVVESRGRHMMFMNKEEVRAFKMGILEVFKIMLLTATYSFVFGFDDDDKDKWKKLKAKSGALPTLFTDDEWSEGWNAQGWLSNHLLLLAMHVEAENEHFIPWPGFGLSDMISLTADTSIAAGPSIHSLKTLFYDFYYTVTGEEKVYYKRDAGALKWQQEESNKFWIHLSKMLAVSGKFIDPATSIKNFRASRESYAQK